MHAPSLTYSRGSWAAPIPTSSIGTGSTRSAIRWTGSRLTPEDNLEDPSVANVKGDRRTKFAVSNWEAWVLAENFSIDEQTTKCQGKCEYKCWCGKFKQLGDGLQGGCIADDGYTWIFISGMSPSM
jgi:hypothetical protein